jgi:hypothetical protein
MRGFAHFAPWIDIEATGSYWCHAEIRDHESGKLPLRVRIAEWKDDKQYSEAVEFYTTEGSSTLLPPVARETTQYMYLTTMFFYPTSGISEAGPFLGPARHVATQSDSQKCLALIKTWTSICDKTHGGCKATLSGFMPHRLVYTGLGLADPDNGIKLTDTRGIDGREYAALSHCWGRKQPLKTTRATLGRHQRHIPWTAIPRTFQDAIQTARAIGLEYIWVDSLCIVQDDAGDWEAESREMMEIYSNAHLTIAATWGTGSDSGCHTTRVVNHIEVWPPPTWPRPLPSSVATKPRVYARLPIDHGGLSALPLLERGWVLQEQMLSRRVLHFTPSELRFQCRTSETCECRFTSCSAEEEQLQLPLADTTPSPYSPAMMVAWEEGGHDDPFRLWHRVVEEYTRRKLTVPSDKLIAISGIARRFEEKVIGSRPEAESPSYLAGLWKRNLMVDLLWTVNDDAADETRHVAKYRAPSWSWASMDGHVKYDTDEYLCFAKEENIVADIVSASVTPDTAGDSFGTLRDGRLTIRGMVTEARLRRPIGGVDPDWTYRRRATFTRRGDPEEYWFDPDRRVTESLAGALNNAFGPAAVRRKLLPGTKILLLLLLRGYKERRKYKGGGCHYVSQWC